VVTTSASANVVEAIQALHRQEMLLGVVCSESRPLLEGTSLARWLAEQGYDVLLTLDAGLADHLVDNTVFLAGTDAILPDSVVNKRGTRSFATWAELCRVPRYVLATRDKLYPPELVPCFENPDRPSTEIVRDPPGSLRVDNRAFDRTPRAVWTEILVGNRTLEEAESSGDHALAEGLRPLLDGAG
jgi:translation initiation factor 2B subunit (eIF-2B alpha/beta/delta family)